MLLQHPEDKDARLWASTQPSHAQVIRLISAKGTCGGSQVRVGTFWSLPGS